MNFLFYELKNVQSNLISDTETSYLPIDGGVVVIHREVPVHCRMMVGLLLLFTGRFQYTVVRWWGSCYSQGGSSTLSYDGGFVVVICPAMVGLL